MKKLLRKMRRNIRDAFLVLVGVKFASRYSGPRKKKAPAPYEEGVQET
ncbi:MAG: hypothetical protein PHU49_08655 [Syntrophorhabdaceae bacterium]|nr:hypothetical protein [Syntrophorhabdaceae bacterium]